MQIVEHEGHYEVFFNYDKKIVNAIKAIKGRAWSHARKAWLIPKDQKARLELFYDKWSNHSKLLEPLQVGVVPELPQLEVLVPLKRPMFPFQERGVAFCLNQKRVIIGDKPGLGKTQQAIAALVAANAFPVLIICPATLKRNWKNEWMTVAGKPAIILDDKCKDNWQKFYQAGVCDVFITNFESVKRMFVHSINKPPNEALMTKHVVFKPTIDLIKSVVVDEAHRCKDLKAQHTKFIIGMSRRKEYLFALTGTPIVNKTSDLIALLWLTNRIHEFGGMSYFEARYCKTNTFLPELQYKLKTTCFYQRKKEEVLHELPAKIRTKMICDITTRKEYDDAVRDLAKYLKEYQQKTDAQVRKSMAGEIMVQIGICKGISARGKMNETVEQIDEIVDAGEKVVVFVYQRRVRDMLTEHYPHAVTISGADSEEDRARNVQAFQTNPKINIIVCNIKAGGVGITLTASSRVVFVELPWHAADCDQCEDRTHRIGQHNQVQATYMIGYRTIDEQIYELIEEKRALDGEITGNVDVTQTEIIDRISDSLFRQ